MGAVNYVISLKAWFYLNLSLQLKSYLFSLFPVPPSVQADPRDGNYVVKKGRKVTLKCNASGNPEPTITWSRLVSHFIIYFSIPIHFIFNAHFFDQTQHPWCVCGIRWVSGANNDSMDTNIEPFWWYIVLCQCLPIQCVTLWPSKNHNQPVGFHYYADGTARNTLFWAPRRKLNNL